MSKIKKYPKVMLVGRMNVGKSTLFNRLTNSTKSIVYEYEGVTRDYLQEVVEWCDKAFQLIDTGGLLLVKHKDEILKNVKERVDQLMEEATLFLFVCDVKNGLTEGDRRIAKKLHKSGKPVLLLLNKADNKKGYEQNYHEFYSLGFKDMLPISATHGSGTASLLQHIVENIPEVSFEDIDKPDIKVSIIGKPNSGKSSLMNLLLKQDRSIVSSVAGTTREAISENVQFYQTNIEITDTAGIRRKSRINEELETLMVKNAFHSARFADVVIAMIDATQDHISDQELKLMFYAFEQKKPLLVIFNKTDLIDEIQKERMKMQIEEYEFFFKKVPVMWTSCKTEKNVGNVLRDVKKLWERSKQEFNTMQLNDLVQEHFSSRPMYHKRQLLKLFKIRFVKAVIPTFVLHVNYPEWFGESQLGFIENVLRKNYDLKGCPVQFAVRRI